MKAGDRDIRHHAALASRPVFTSDAADPIVCQLQTAVPSELKAAPGASLQRPADPFSAALQRYLASRFCILRTDSTCPEQAIRAVAAGLNLGEPFLPPLYGRGAPDPSPLSRISMESGPGHPSFQSDQPIPLHCDGTLQPLGMIKSSVLFCQRPASRGGESVLFNAAGAIADLFETDCAAAHSLFEPRTLRRQANINGSRDFIEGPVARVDDGVLQCSYTVALTDSWCPPPEPSRAAFERAVAALDAAARPPSAYILTFRLEAGELLLLDNTRLSHARLGYVDDEPHRRTLYRGLFLQHPTSGAPEDV